MGKTLVLLLIVGAALSAAPAFTSQNRTIRRTTVTAVKSAAAQKRSKVQAAAGTRRVVRRRRVGRTVSPSQLLMARYVQPDLSTFPEMSAPLPDLAAAELRDSFFAARVGRRVHQAIDIMRPEGTPLYACVDGYIAMIQTSALGGQSVYVADASGRHKFYYAHLSGYAEDLVEGMPVMRGQLIGYVGSTGNARFTGPHLHFQIIRDSRNVNPYPVLRNVVDGSAIPIQPAMPAPVAAELLQSALLLQAEAPAAVALLSSDPGPLVVPDLSITGGGR